MCTGTKALRELTVRYTVKTDADGKTIQISPTLRSAGVAAEWLKRILQDEATEVVGIVCLSTRLRVLAYHEVSRGCLDSATVHPREVFKAAILANAATIVLVHNHPSGDPVPSPDDRELTRRLSEAGELLGVHLTDHIVIGDDGYFSFREAGLL